MTTSTVFDSNVAAAGPASTEVESLSERTANANRVITGYVLGSMAAAVIPIPVADLAAVAAVQLKMLHSLANTFNLPFKKDWGKAALSSLIGGVLPIASTPLVLSSLVKFIPVGGQIVGMSTQAVLNGATTYAVGKVFVQHFASGGTFLTFDPQKVRAYFLAQMEEGKKVVADLKVKEGTPGPNGRDY